MIVFTNGCWDLLHSGHVSILRFCRELAGPDGTVIVAVNSDASISRLKGPSRPVMSTDERVASVGLLNIADQIVVFDEDDPTELVKRFRPDVLVKGADYAPGPVAGQEYAGRVEFRPLIPGVSTTAAIAAAAGR